MRTVTACIVSLVLAGCTADGFDPAPAPPPPVPTLADQVKGVTERMHLRWAGAARLESAVAHGDLERAHLEAKWIAASDEPDARAVLQPYLEDIRSTAGSIAVAADLGEAARLTGALGMRCAQCHQATASHLVLPVEPRPPANPAEAPQMTGHQWAASQMWEGLIAASDERWDAGAHELTTMPLNMVAQAVTRTSDVDIDDVARVRLYATRALNMKKLDDRAELFGQLLETCAHCHALLRDR